MAEIRETGEKPMTTEAKPEGNQTNEKQKPKIGQGLKKKLKGQR